MIAQAHENQVGIKSSSQQRGLPSIPLDIVATARSASSLPNATILKCLQNIGYSQRGNMHSSDLKITQACANEFREATQVLKK